MSEQFQQKVLICATMWWPSAARLAIAFVRSGCNVSAICPPGHPLRVVTGITSIYSYRSLSSANSLQTAIRAVKPQLIIACDDCVVWQLHAIHASDPDLRPLIELSLGSPQAYPTIRQRNEVLRVAEGLGIRVPFTQTINSVAEIKNWKFNEPAALKTDGSFGGEGVKIVRSTIEAEREFHSASGLAAAGTAWKRFLINRNTFALWSWRRRSASGLSLQKFVAGRPANTMLACWQGKVLASVTVEVLASQGPTGAACVVRVLENSEIDEAARRLVERFGLSGFHGVDFILEEGTGHAYMIELNARATQLGHLNLTSKGDLAAVIVSALEGDQQPAIPLENGIQNNIIAFFPTAFKADPESEYLSHGYHDIPWEEPALARELALDPWPERQMRSRIYHYFRAGKKSEKSRQAFQPMNPKWPKLGSSGKLPDPGN